MNSKLQKFFFSLLKFPVIYFKFLSRFIRKSYIEPTKERKEKKFFKVAYDDDKIAKIMKNIGNRERKEYNHSITKPDFDQFLWSGSMEQILRHGHPFGNAIIDGLNERFINGYSPAFVEDDLSEKMNYESYKEKMINVCKKTYAKK